MCSWPDVGVNEGSRWDGTASIPTSHYETNGRLARRQHDLESKINYRRRQRCEYTALSAPGSFFFLLGPGAGVGRSDGTPFQGQAVL